MPNRIEDWLLSVKRYLEYWMVIRICPHQIEAPEELLSFNILTAAVSTVIILLARMSIAGSESGIEIAIIATIISVVIAFLTGYVTLIRNPGQAGMEKANKWGAFFVSAWLTSLICLIALDAIPFWSGYPPVTTILINLFAEPGTVSPLGKDLMRAGFFGILAMGILLYKSYRMDKTFHILNGCALPTIVIGLLMNTALMQVFIYSHFV